MSENKLKVIDYALSPWPKELLSMASQHHKSGLILIPINPQPKNLGGGLWEFGEWIHFEDSMASDLFHDHYGNDLAKELLGVEIDNIHPITTGYGIVPDDTRLRVTDIYPMVIDKEGVWYWELSVELFYGEVQHE